MGRVTHKNTGKSVKFVALHMGKSPSLAAVPARRVQQSPFALCFLQLSVGSWAMGDWDWETQLVLSNDCMETNEPEDDIMCGVEFGSGRRERRA